MRSSTRIPLRSCESPDQSVNFTVYYAERHCWGDQADITDLPILGTTFPAREAIKHQRAVLNFVQRDDVAGRLQIVDSALLRPAMRGPDNQTKLVKCL